MSAQPILRPRSRGRRERRRLRLAFAPAAGPVSAPSGDVPNFGFREAESARAAVLSGSVTTLLHAAVIAALLFFAWLAPEVKDVVIPVTVLKEAPGSKEAPAPKSLAPRRPLAADLAAVAAQTAVTDAPNPLSPEVFEQAQVARAQVPESFERRELDAQHLEAQRTVEAPRALDVATLSAAKVSPSELRAPTFQYEGPRAIDTRTRVDSLSPEAFAAPRPVARDYQGAATQVVRPPSAAVTGAAASPGADTRLSGRWLGGGDGTGGTGTAVGTVACDESAPVARYYAEMQRRAAARWEVPAGAPTDQPVVLRFELDVSGSITHVEFMKAANPELGQSAVRALRAASPFPPLDGDVRECLTGPLLATFDVPSL